MKILILIIKTTLSIIIAMVLSLFIISLIKNNNSAIFSLNIDESYPDLIIEKLTNENDYDSRFIENTDDIIFFINNLLEEEFGNLIYTSIIKIKANINTEKAKANINIYGVEQESFDDIVGSLKNTTNTIQYTIIDSSNYEVILGSNLAKTLSLLNGDDIIINMTGDNFMYYSDIFNVKFISSLENADFNNSIIMSKDYINSLLNIDDSISTLIYLNTDKKNKIDDIKHILLENFSNINVATKNDYIYSYDLYIDILKILPVIHAALFLSILLFMYMFNIKSRYSALEMINDKFKNQPIMTIVFITELIISMSIFVIALSILENISTHSYMISSVSELSNNGIYIILASLLSITAATSITYLICFVKSKR